MAATSGAEPAILIHVEPLHPSAPSVTQLLRSSGPLGSLRPCSNSHWHPIHNLGIPAHSVALLVP